MKRSVILFTIVFIAMTFSSCKENGLGGDATIVTFLQHHGRTIKNHVGYPDTVFVKFNATDLPGTTPNKFDTYFVGTVGEDHVNCRGLLAGKYYFYGVAMDSAGPYRVTGGMAIRIAWADRKKELNDNLAVTE